MSPHCLPQLGRSQGGIPALLVCSVAWDSVGGCVFRSPSSAGVSGLAVVGVFFRERGRGGFRVRGFGFGLCGLALVLVEVHGGLRGSGWGWLGELWQLGGLESSWVVGWLWLHGFERRRRTALGEVDDWCGRVLWWGSPVGLVGGLLWAYPVVGHWRSTGYTRAGAFGGVAPFLGRGATPWCGARCCPAGERACKVWVILWVVPGVTVPVVGSLLGNGRPVGGLDWRGVCSGGKWGGVGSWRGVRQAAVGVVPAARPVVGSVEGLRRVARVVAQLLGVVQRLGRY